MKSFIANVLVAGLVLSGAAVAETINVPGDYPDVQDAIEASSDGDLVLIAPGVYEGEINFYGKAIEVRGSLGSEGECLTVIDAQQVYTTVLFTNGEQNDSVLRQLIITGGGGVVNGGGIECNGTSPSIIGCIITGNETQDAAGIYCRNGASPLISDCVISNNVATGVGAGIGINLGSSPVIVDCTIEDNHAGSNGGGIWCFDNSNPTITDCVISGNISGQFGGGIYCGQNSSPTISGCYDIMNNQAADGGGLSAFGSSLQVENCEFKSNVATSDGGAMYLRDGGATTISDVLFANNNASSDGGGVVCYDSSPQIDSCHFEGNRCFGNSDNLLGDGGAICVYSNSSPVLTSLVLMDNHGTRGGGIWIETIGDHPVLITDCTIKFNTAQDTGGALYITSGPKPVLSGSEICGNSSVQIHGSWTSGNCNQIDLVCAQEAACCTGNEQVCVELVTEESCLLFGGTWLGIDASCQDCQFVEEKGACCVNGLCAVMTDVQCFEIGGAYAGDNVSCEKAACPEFCLGDVNGDGQIGVVDLLTIIDGWGLCP